MIKSAKCAECGSVPNIKTIPNGEWCVSCPKGCDYAYVLFRPIATIYWNWRQKQKRKMLAIK